MKKFGITFMTHQPQQIILDAEGDEPPITYGSGIASMTLPDGRSLTIPISDFMGCEEIPEESKIVPPGKLGPRPM